MGVVTPLWLKLSCSVSPAVADPVTVAVFDAESCVPILVKRARAFCKSDALIL